MIKKQRNINFGAAILFVIFGLLFFVLLFRFVYIQDWRSERSTFSGKSRAKIYRTRTIEAKRGTIYDRNGEVIAEDRSSYSLIAILDKKMTMNPKEPNHVVDIEKTASELAKHIDIKESDIRKILNNGKKEEKFQVEFGAAGRDITYEMKKKIEKLKLPGITFTRELKRFYPNGIFASHVIGFTETEQTEENKTITVGKLGLEKSLNDVLTGTNGSFKFESDVWGYLLPNGKEQINAS